MGVHDVIVECERFSLDLTDRCPHDSCQYPSGFRSRSGTTNSNLGNCLFCVLLILLLFTVFKLCYSNLTLKYYLKV